MSRARRIARRLAPWLGCFAGGWGLAAWLFADPHPAPWQAIVSTVAGVILLTLVVIDLEAQDRAREREAFAARRAELIARYRREQYIP